ERMVYSVINSLMRMGAEVFYEQDEDLHVSGHASQEELKLMISLTKPKFFMPIHGEYRHLRAHVRIAESLGIKSSRCIIAGNGDILELSKKSFEKTGELHLNQIYVDGQDIEDVGNGVIHDRKSMSAEGIVLVTVVTAEGMLVRPPEIVAKGFVAGKNIKLIDAIRADVQAQTHRMLADGAQEKEITVFLRKHLKNSIFRLTRRNPLIEVQVMDI
ncbi:MAG: ribonuclease J, partial [Spirochaetales bacterium]